MIRTSPQSPAEFRFGGVVVDVDRREVRVDGQRVDLQPKAFDLLSYLIRHRDRVVDRDELMEALWPGLVVTDDSLTQALRRARRVVGDDGTRQAVIRTVQRRGFRFVATLDAPAGDEPAATSSISAAPQGSATTEPPSSTASPAGAAATITALAVLPFLDLSPARDQRYFCDGIAEELANALGQVPRLRVAARTSAFAFRDDTVEAREIARRLGVDALVEGSVRRAGDQLRVTAKLVDADGFQCWTSTWDRPLTDVFVIQEEIARQVVAALRERQADFDGTPPRPLRGTSIAAYDLYLRGLEHLRRFGRRSQRYALQMFADALELDPGYAPAWAGVATSRLLLYTYSEASEENRQGAIEAGRRAVQLDPMSAEAHVGAANAAILAGDSTAAEAAFERAHALNPGLYEAWYHHARSCAARGDYERAIEYYVRAAAARPEDFDALCLVSQCYASLGRREETLQAQERAVFNAERALQLQPDNVRALALSGSSLIATGRRDQARRWAGRALALDPDEPYVNYCAACTFAQLGEIDGALDSLERVGVEKMANASWMDHDSSLDPLRGHPRFEALRRRAR